MVFKKVCVARFARAVRIHAFETFEVTLVLGLGKTN